MTNNLLKPLALAGAIALAACGNNEVVKRDCEKFQGFRPIDEGEIVYVFDSLPSTLRSERGQYSIRGHANLRKELEDQRKYCFEYKETRMGKVMISIEPADETAENPNQ